MSQPQDQWKIGQRVFAVDRPGEIGVFLGMSQHQMRFKLINGDHKGKVKRRDRTCMRKFSTLQNANRDWRNHRKTK